MSISQLAPTFLISAVDLLGSLILVGFSLAAVLALLGRQPIRRARLLVIEGVLWGLSVKTAVALLKMIELRTWNEIGIFAAILMLRLLVKSALDWERRCLSAAEPQ
jgi:Protein of unknown function (DUF1622)